MKGKEENRKAERKGRKVVKIGEFEFKALRVNFKHSLKRKALECLTMQHHGFSVCVCVILDCLFSLCVSLCVQLETDPAHRAKVRTYGTWRSKQDP